VRIKLKKGKQKEFILLAKGIATWMEFSKKLGVPANYLAGDMKSEKVLISKEIFNKLCEISGEDFDLHVIDVLKDNWGRSMGGLNSPGSTISIKIPEYCFGLAEFVGAVLGDGHVHYTKKSYGDKKVGVYQIRITGDLRYEKEYHHYLGELAKTLFNLIPRYSVGKNKNERYLFLSSRNLVEFFIKMGISPGSKITNQSTIPQWIYKNSEYMKACLRGLMDTDGCIHSMSKRDFNLLRINFKNHNYRLLHDTRKMFISLGFHPSKIICGNVFYISRQGEIDKYLKEIGFSNKKHLDRLNEFKAL